MTKVIIGFIVIILTLTIIVFFGNLNYNGNQAQAAHYIGNGSWSDEACEGCHSTADTDVLNSYHVQNVNNKFIEAEWNILHLNLLDTTAGKRIAAGCDQCHIHGIPTHSASIATAAAEVECTSCHFRKDDLYTVHDSDGIIGGSITTDCATCHQEDRDSDDGIIDWTSPSEIKCARECHLSDVEVTAQMWGSDDYNRYDVHANANVTCLECHVTENHQISKDSIVNFSKPSDDTYPMKQCIDCHAGITHGMIVDSHIKKVGCEACHVPILPGGELSGGMPISSIDYSTGHKKVTYRHQDFLPSFGWFNGIKEGIPHSCDKEDPDAILKPCNVISITWWDEGNDKNITSNPNSSTLRGIPILLSHVRAAGIIKDSNKSIGNMQNFDFNYDKIPDYPNAVLRNTDAYYPVSHNIVSKESALGKSALWCADCHGNTSVIDWIALGYESDPAQTDPPTDFTTYEVTVEIIPERPKPVEVIK